MTDIFSKLKRSEIMSKIRSRNTKPELALKKLLKGYEYQPKEFGRPDFINYRKKEIIFIDGCFWHKCPKHFTMPLSNRRFWNRKIDRNILRDSEVTLNYINSGWRVKRIWEHEIKNNSNPNLL